MTDTTANLKAAIGAYLDRLLLTKTWAQSGNEAAEAVLKLISEAGWRSSADDTETAPAKIQADALLSAADAARKCAREATQGDMGTDVIRHWRATSSFLRRRAEAIEAGHEPDWPDAADSALDDGSVGPWEATP